jgi:hypothetical protein
MPDGPNEQHDVDLSGFSPEERQLFITLVEYLLEDNSWMLPEEARMYAYQQICFRNIEQMG